MLPVQNFLHKAVTIGIDFDKNLPTSLNYVFCLRDTIINKMMHEDKWLRVTLSFLFNITPHLSNISAGNINELEKNFFYNDELNLFAICFVLFKYTVENQIEKIKFDLRDMSISCFVMDKNNFSMYDYRDVSFHDSYYEEVSEVKNNLANLLRLPDKRINRTREQNILLTECREIYKNIK